MPDLCAVLDFRFGLWTRPACFSSFHRVVFQSALVELKCRDPA